MGNKTKKKISDRIALFACYFLAFTSLFAAVYMTQELLQLLNRGERAEAIVSGIHSGARNTKTAIYQFTTSSGQEISARDRFPMYFIRLHTGDRVTVIYDPSDTGLVTADLGLWVWQGPAIFLFGFIFLSTLGVFIFRSVNRLRLSGRQSG